jgi:hypothetical protein
VETESARFVQKVHPATRAVEPEDPMTLHATPVEGDVEVMLHLLVQEYAWMGWNGEQILRLFRDPFYPALHGLWCQLGEAGVRERIARVLARSGVLRFEATVDDEDDAEIVEPDLVQIGSAAHLGAVRPPRSPSSSEAGVPSSSTREGGSDAEGL